MRMRLMRSLLSALLAAAIAATACNEEAADAQPQQSQQQEQSAAQEAGTEPSVQQSQQTERESQTQQARSLDVPQADATEDSAEARQGQPAEQQRSASVPQSTAAQTDAQQTSGQQAQGYGAGAYGGQEQMSTGEQPSDAGDSIPPVRRWLTEGVALTPSHPSERDEYGWGAAIEGDVLAVSAPYHDAQGPDTGAVFVFERIDDVWSETAYLVPEFPDPHGWFGRWLALGDGRLVIGAPYEDVVGIDGVKLEDSGVAYVYEKIGGEWRRTGTLLPETPRAGASLGWSASISGDRIAIAAWQDPMALASGEQGEVGSVTTYVQRKGLWQPEAVFRPNNPSDRHMFGRDIELYDNILVVGAPGDDTIAEDAGAIFVWHFYNNTWNFTGKLLASDGAAADRLGSQVALHGRWLASGAYDHDQPSWSSGAVYVWKLDNLWNFHTKLQPSDLQPGDWFGYSLDVKGDLMVVGSPHRAHPESGTYRSGAAYVFELIDDQWVELGVLGPVSPIEAGERAEFGWVTEVDGTTVVVGAWLANAEAGEDAGDAAVYELPTDFEIEDSE